MWCGIEILIKSFTNSIKILEIKKNGNFTLFVGVSMATANMQIDVWEWFW